MSFKKVGNVVRLETHGQIIVDLDLDTLKSMVALLQEDKVKTVKDEYIKDMVSKKELCSYLGVNSFEINRMSRLNLILSVPSAKGNLYPLWQFDTERRPFSCMAEVINMIGKDCNWTTVQFFNTDFIEISGLSPVKYLRLKGDKGNFDVITACRRYLRQG